SAATVAAGATRTNPTAPLGGPDAAPAGPHGTLVADGPAPQTPATRYDGTPLAGGPVPHPRYDGTPGTPGFVPPGAAPATHHAGPGMPPPGGGWPPAGPGPGVPGAPFSPAPNGVRPGGGRPRRGRWIALGAGLVVVAVAAAVLLWVFRDRHPALDFHTAELVKTVPAGDTRPGQMFTATLGNRSYLVRSLPDGHLHVTAVETATGTTVWEKRTDAATQRWAGIRALQDGLLVLGEGTGSTPRVLAVLDGDSGKQRWRTDVGRDDALFFGPDTVVRVDRDGGRLVGLRLDDGRQRWERRNPRTEYGDARTKVLPVGTGAALDGPGNAEGSPLVPWAGKADRLVQVGADRSVRVLELRSGKILKDRGNVAGLDDPMAARDDRLYVAEDDRGLRLLSYDLGGLGTPSVLYEAPEQGGRVKDLVTCGERRVCLLETPPGGADGTRVVAATEGEGTRQWAAPRAGSLVPVGEHVLAVQGSPDAVTLFAPDGTAKVLRDREGFAVRLDAGNLLIFSEAPSAYEDDRVLAGTAVDGKPVEMGQLKQIRSESCSWNTEMLVCGADKEFRLYRFAG
uniref:outer membrane protein assembly factor BamB family protein n=1 Tax=Micromonospora chalcea TaxID=1874 RepID=UPI00157BF95A